MKALICLAGEGKRLRPLTADRPKPLIRVGEKTILEYMLDNISASGIEEAVLITGYREEKVKELIGTKHKGCSIKYYSNKDYGTTDNMFSLWVARDEIDDGIVFFNGDIIFHKDILKNLLESEYENSLAVDDQIDLVEDSMKVKIKEGKLNEISKKVKAGDGWAMGIYKLSPEGAKDYYGEVEKLIKTGGPGSSFVRPLEIISSQRDIYPVSTRGLPWAEIDDFRDLEYAKANVNKIMINI